MDKGKYFIDQYKNYTKYNGWFISSFFPTDYPAKCDKVEVQYAEHPADHICRLHYHQQKVEIIIMLEGKAVITVNGQPHDFKTGDFFFADVDNQIEVHWLEKCKCISIHAPSITTDKVLVKK